MAWTSFTFSFSIFWNTTSLKLAPVGHRVRRRWRTNQWHKSGLIFRSGLSFYQSLMHDHVWCMHMYAYFLGSWIFFQTGVLVIIKRFPPVIIPRLQDKKCAANTYLMSSCLATINHRNGLKVVPIVTCPEQPPQHLTYQRVVSFHISHNYRDMNQNGSKLKTAHHFEEIHHGH